MVTLSLVITGWGGKSITCSLSETLPAMRSMSGSLKCSPTSHVPLYPPSLSITYALACGTIRMFGTMSARTSKSITTVVMNCAISISSLYVLRFDDHLDSFDSGDHHFSLFLDFFTIF